MIAAALPWSSASGSVSPSLELCSSLALLQNDVRRGVGNPPEIACLVASAAQRPTVGVEPLDGGHLREMLSCQCAW